ncbi:MAG: alpha/beta hydrolase [Cyanobacteria bacterium HKST-UBA02]|nr:alpha/beta hydrolase [Cyanobacteria bacterium HKST-UBA02]
MIFAVIDQVTQTIEVQTSSQGIEYCTMGNGPAVLAIHGSPGGYDHAMLYFEDLAEKGFSLVIPSRPGFLGTPLELGRTIAEQAELLAGLMNELGIESFFLCGFSCGGATAVRIAARYPDRVLGMILESPVTMSFAHGSTDGFHGKLLLCDLGSFGLRLLIDHAPLHSIARLLDRQASYSRQRVREEARRIFEDEETRRLALTVLERCMPASRRVAGMLNDADQLRDFANHDLELVECQTLIVHGSADGEVPLAHAEFAAEKIKRAQLMVVPDACHLLCLSPQWEQIRKTRQKFLESLSGDRLAISQSH